MNKRFYRSRSNQVIAGVCAGLGEYFQLDPVLVRVIFILLAILTKWFMVILYVALWAFVPEAPDYAIPNQEIPMQEEVPKQRRPRREHGKVTGGLILIALGVVFLLQNFLPAFDFGKLWPVILLAVGIGMLWEAFRRKPQEEDKE